MKSKIFSCLLCFALLGPALLSGQAQPYRLQSNRLFNAGFSYESWKAGEDKITQMAIPLSFIYPHNDKTSLYAMTSPAFANLETGETYSLEGLSDVKFGGHSLLFNDSWLLTFGLNLPVGKSMLGTDEYNVASVLTLPALNFRVPSFGQGFDVQVGMNTARELGSMMMGLGVSYLMKGGFKPFSGYDESYNPGDELTFTVGFSGGRIMADFLYTLYWDDTWGGEAAFRSGNRLVAQLTTMFKMGSSDLILFVRDRIKAKNKTGSGELFETERKNTNANQLEIQGHLLRPSSAKMQLKGIVDMRIYSNNDYGFGAAKLFGFGGGFRYGLSQNTVLDTDLRYYFGKIETGAGEVDATGLKLFGGVVVTL